MRPISTRLFAVVVLLFTLVFSASSFAQTVRWQYTVLAPAGSRVVVGHTGLDEAPYPYGLFLGSNGVCVFPITVETGNQDSTSQTHRLVWLSSTGSLRGNVDLATGEALSSVLSATQNSIVVATYRNEGNDTYSYLVKSYVRNKDGSISLAKTAQLPSGFWTYAQNQASGALLSWEYKDPSTKTELVLKRYSL